MTKGGGSSSAKRNSVIEAKRKIKTGLDNCYSCLSAKSFIQCNACKTWVCHNCAELGDDFADPNKILEKRLISFFCAECFTLIKRMTVKILGEISEDDADGDTFREKLLHFSKNKPVAESGHSSDQFSSMAEKINSIETRLGEMTTILENQRSSELTQVANASSKRLYSQVVSQMAVIEKNTTPVAQEDERIRTLVVSGLVEPTGDNVETRRANDKSQVARLFEVLSDNPPRDFLVRRLGERKAGVSRLVKVTLQSEDQKINLLKARLRLRNSDYTKVYINHDLTVAQREKRRELLSQAKELNKECGPREKYVLRERPNSLSLIKIEVNAVEEAS